MNKITKFLRNLAPIFLAAVLLLLFGVGLTPAEAFLPSTDIAEYDFDRLGSVDAPTTDGEELERALTVLGQKSLNHKGGWLHFRYSAYNPPDGVDHPLHSKDGHYFTDMWYDVNESGVIERLLGIRSDTHGNELQVIACGDGLCGNLSILQMGEDYNGPAIGDFAPNSRPSATAGILADIGNTQSANVSGWMEGEGDNQTLYIAISSNQGKDKDLENPLVNSRVVQGFNTSTGELAHLKTSLQTRDGIYEVHLQEDLVTFEVLEEDAAVEERYLQVISELQKGE